METILLTGATGFVGRHMRPSLGKSGLSVRCATRDLFGATSVTPNESWVRLDLEDPLTLEPAMRGVTAAFYLVHSMSEGPGYEARERAAAEAFRDAAARAGVERIIYLGGIEPLGHPSRHLESRRMTGEILRSGSVPVFELHASMIIGEGSISWKVVRDLASRLPAMILPRWLQTRTEPIAIDDVVYALTQVLTLPIELAGVWDLPGPEVLSCKEILLRVAALRGIRTVTLDVPVLTPRLSSYWLKLVTGADFPVARELVDGLSSDLISHGRSIWDELGEHEFLSFDEAVKRAHREDGETPAHPRRILERLVTHMSRHPKAA